MTVDQSHRQRPLGPISGYRDAAFRWPCAARLVMILESAAVTVLVVSVLAGAALAQSPSSLQSSPIPSSLQSSPMPEQQTPTAAVIPSATAAPPEYRVGMGDVLGISVYDMPELGRTAVVGSKGTLLLSYFPQPLEVTGKTAQGIGQEVASELKRLQVLLDPQVSVTVLRVESKPVVVGGDVRNPHVLQEMRPLTLLEALMLVGGPGDNAGNSVLVTRADGTGSAISYDLPLSKVLSGTDPNSNILIKPGDTIQVLPDQKVFVAGAIKSPGAFPLGRGQRLTVSTLMALSGGWEADANPAKAVIVRQGTNGQRQTVPVNLPKIMARKQHDVALEPNDLLYVPGSTGKKVSLAVIKGVGGAAMLGLGYLIVRP